MKIKYLSDDKIFVDFPPQIYQPIAMVPATYRIEEEIPQQKSIFLGKEITRHLLHSRLFDKIEVNQHSIVLYLDKNNEIVKKALLRAQKKEVSLRTLKKYKDLRCFKKIQFFPKAYLAKVNIEYYTVIERLDKKFIKDTTSRIIKNVIKKL